MHHKLINVKNITGLTVHLKMHVLLMLQCCFPRKLVPPHLEICVQGSTYHWLFVYYGSQGYMFPSDMFPQHCIPASHL